MPATTWKVSFKTARNPVLAGGEAPVTDAVKKSDVTLTLGGSRDVPDNDTCENAIPVATSYPTTICGTNVGATDDCPAYFDDYEGVWYAIELPYEYNTLVTDYCATDLEWPCELGIICYEDCNDCSAFIVGETDWQDCGDGSWSPKIWWEDLPGPTTVLLPIWINPAQDFCITVDVTESFPCSVDCPEGSVAESEACGEDTNGGCGMDTPAFEPLTCGETVCGTGWAEGGGRDTDWYEITIDEPTFMTWTVAGEFESGVWAGLVETEIPGVPDCDLLSGTLIDHWAYDCEEFSITYAARPGTYWWFVCPVGYQRTSCDARNQYVATMRCQPWEIRGACCDEDTGICRDGVLMQDCPEPMRFTENTLCADLMPPCGGCPESTIEIEIQTDYNPSETTWEITDHDTGAVICSGGPYETQFWTYFAHCCIGADDCFDFTIYDSYGDGHGTMGGYAVRLDGVELISTIESGWYGAEITHSGIGANCEAGRCCYEPWPNCADATLLDCVSVYDGVWTEGLTCETDPCQNPDIPDFEVTAPYTSPQRTTCGGIDRCQPEGNPLVHEEHVYLVTIPNDGLWSFNTCLETTSSTWLSVGTSMCETDIGWNAGACGESAELVVTLDAGEYFVTVENRLLCGTYVLDIHEVIPCDVECPADATRESEPCGESINKGCHGQPAVFEPIALNQPICGTLWAANMEADNDWFEFVAPADDTITWSVRTNFDGIVGVAHQIVPGEPGCSNLSGLVTPKVWTWSDCEDASVSFPVVAGGTYYLCILHQTMYNNPCGTTNDYVATLTGTNNICGDLDGDGDVDHDDYMIFLGAFGTCVGEANYVAEADFDGDGCITLVDYQSWVVCYRDTNPGGKSPMLNPSAKGKIRKLPVGDIERP
jgi:hypothetical protein